MTVWGPRFDKQMRWWNKHFGTEPKTVMAHVTSENSRRSFSRRGHLVLIAFLLLNFTKCNETLSKLQTTRLSDNILLQESLVIPSKNAESEARRLYDEALKQYGDLGKTLKEICQPWKAKGCACTGSAEEVVLSCRGLDLISVPENLPEELIKLWVVRESYSKRQSKLQG